MRPAPLLLVLVGALVLLAGVVFTLQGLGVVGPRSSFMYENPAWIYQGVTAALIGALILIGGLVLARRRPAVGSG